MRPTLALGTTGVHWMCGVLTALLPPSRGRRADEVLHARPACSPGAGDILRGSRVEEKPGMQAESSGRSLLWQSQLCFKMMLSMALAACSHSSMAASSRP